jgi:cyclopropane-fatty-acyl-phospholipid synthase
VHNPDFFPRVLRGGSLALGESYMAGWWDSEALDQFFFKVLANGLEERVKNSKLKMIVPWIKSVLSNPQNPQRAWKVGEVHYDIGNELFEKMLGPSMAYSCGYWRDAENVNQAQEAKFELICQKLGLKHGMSLLDIGCGWGGLARHAAEKHGANVTGITISKEQASFARQLCNGLPVEIRLEDYRDLTGQFDRIASVGMYEHVGGKNYRTFMEVAARILRPQGLFMLHTISKNQQGAADPWVVKYIFPNGELPTPAQIIGPAEALFIPQDVHNIGPDYDRTLMAWHENFNNHWDDIRKKAPAKYTPIFERMWNYYLQSCAGAFRAGTLNVLQTVFSKGNPNSRYNCVRELAKGS